MWRRITKSTFFSITCIHSRPGVFSAYANTIPNSFSVSQDYPKNTAHVFDVHHTVHPSLNPCVSREPTLSSRLSPNIHPLPLCCPVLRSQLEKWRHECASKYFVRARELRTFALEENSESDKDKREGAGDACITSGLLAGEEKNCHRLHRLLDRRGEKRKLASKVVSFERCRRACACIVLQHVYPY